MSDFPEWAAFAGLADNQALSVEERLASAKRAIELLEVALSQARAKKIVVLTKIKPDAPQAWKDLIEGLTLLSRGQNNEISPTHCEHDQMTVCADPHKFTRDELVKLDSLGFFVSGHTGFKDDGTDDEDEDEEGSVGDCSEREDCDAYFKSFRFGSA